MTVEQGARFKARRPVRTTCLISWAAPFTSGHDAILPEGEIITVRSTPPPGASAVCCAPLRYDALHGYFVDEGTRASRRYTGYHLAIDLVGLRESCEPVDETAAPATASPALEDPWAGAPGPATESAVIGCLLGTAVGDALGLPYEGMSRRRAQRLAGSLERHRFLPGRGMVSDDTEHTCMVAQSLIESAGDDARFLGALARRLRWWLLALPAGTGLATLRSGVKLLLGVPPAASGVWSAGNGAAMRAPVIGAAYGHDRERLIRLVRASTRLTHRDPRAEHGALAVAVAAWLATRPEPITPACYLDVLSRVLALDEAGELLRYLHLAAHSATDGEDTETFAASLGLARGVSGYVCHTVPVAIHAWLRHPRDYRAALTSVIRCGGDTDTAGAITGAIVGAGTGPDAIPAPWREGLVEWPRSVGWMTDLGHRLAETAASGEAQPAPGLAPAAILSRNLFFLTVVLLHGLRRLLPPYR